MAAHARVAELVDAHDSKSCSARSGGSIPSTGTSLRCYGWQVGFTNFDEAAKARRMGFATHPTRYPRHVNVCSISVHDTLTTA
jgi:hypothetical protein